MPKNMRHVWLPEKHRNPGSIFVGNWIAVFRGFKLMEINVATFFPGICLSKTYSLSAPIFFSQKLKLRFSL